MRTTFWLAAAAVVAAAGVTAAVPAPAPRYTGDFAPAEAVKMADVNGNSTYTGTQRVGMTAVTVYCSLWYNAAGLNLNDPADVAKLKDLVRVQVVLGNGQTEIWEYDGPAKAGWDLEFGGLDGGTYNCEKQGPNGGLGVFQNCVIALIRE